ncbi:MAG: hypothetical protein ACH34V_03670 [Flavobacterium sp.]|uniref:hypothetical protein n=1 Tax=Flavobacterium sp. TaxID=239 RepID=UPI0037AAD31F
MKNTIKLFGLVLVSISIFSCTTDEYDAELEKNANIIENTQSELAREGEGDEENTQTAQTTSTTEETQPVVVVKRD